MTVTIRQPCQLADFGGSGSLVTVNKSLMVMGIPSIAKKSRNVASVSSVTARTDTLEGFIKRWIVCLEMRLGKTL